MNDSKSALESLTIWGVLTTLIATICAHFHHPIDSATQTDIGSWLIQAFQIGGGAVALVGRVRATKQITSVAPASGSTTPLILFLAGLSLAMMFGCTNSATIQPAALSPTDRLVIAEQTLTSTTNTITAAVKSGVINHATALQIKPFLHAAYNEIGVARTAEATGDPAFPDAVGEAEAAVAALNPFLAQARGAPRALGA
jgi:hypothetical protein